jgi:hypothetical protein
LTLENIDRIAANAAANGVVAGAASAAQGGDFKDAAITGAATSLANSAYTVYTTAKLDMRPGTEPYSKGYERWMGPTPENAPPADWNGDIRQLDYRRDHIGKYSTSPHPSDWRQEGSNFMRGVNKTARGECDGRPARHRLGGPEVSADRERGHHYSGDDLHLLRQWGELSPNFGDGAAGQAAAVMG